MENLGAQRREDEKGAEEEARMPENDLKLVIAICYMLSFSAGISKVWSWTLSWEIVEVSKVEEHHKGKVITH